MIKAIFFDIDGTILNGNKGIPNSTLLALDKLREKDIKTIICTGRGYDETMALNIENIDAYILLNGQIAYDNKDNVLYKKPIKNKDKLIELFNNKKIPFGLVDERNTYLNYIDDYVRYVHDTVNLRMPEVKEYDGQEIYQALAYGKVKDYIEKELPDFLAVSWHFDGVDIVPKDSGKDKGIIEYCKLRNIDIKDTMSFGDGDNDREMLKTTGIGVAMGNAIDSVKVVADYITDRIDEDGIYNALVHFGVIDD